MIVLLFLLLILLAGPVLIGIIYAFVVGVRALDWQSWHPLEFKLTRCFLALNLCEPAINAVLIAILYFHQGPADTAMPLRLSAPMAVLLVPALGLWFSDRFYREKSISILLLGAGRWALNVVIFGAVGAIDTGGFWLGLLAFILGTVLLWRSLLWGQAQLRSSLAGPPRPIPQPSFSVPLPRAPRTSMAPHSAPAVPPAVPLDPAKAILCAICQAPTAPAGDSCPSCGLVFVSRVPQALRSLQSYTVLRPLGSGGMSSVYLARVNGSDHLCVLKTLASVDAPLAMTQHAEGSLCLQREAALLGQLDHPRVAHVLDWVSDSRGDFLVLEYIAGPTLEQRLTRLSAQGRLLPGAPLPPTEALAYGAAVAETLSYLAALPQPVVHCDIKPANLIVPPESRAPVLVDFGGAVRAQAGPQPTVLLGRYGTPGYAAPEQYAGSSSPQSDVYGLAATLYHLLTDDDPSAHPLAFPALATLPAELSAALARALERDLDARPDAWEFGAQLRRLAA